MKQFKLVALGGTFDHLHNGHKSLFTKAFSISERVIIGITADEFVTKKKLVKQIQSFDTRKQNLSEYLNHYYNNNRFQFIKLTDIYGPTLSDPYIEALVIGPKTIEGAKKVNEARLKQGMKKLKIIEAEFIKSEDHKYLSSTRIRKGEINRHGDIYAHLFNSNIRVSENFRRYLQQIHGKIINNYEEFPHYISNTQFPIVWVGDSAGEFFVKNKLSFTLGIFDLKTERKPNLFFQDLLQKQQIDKVFNKAGVIHHKLYKNLQSIILRKKQYLYVQGEEDLAVIPLILLLPLNSFIFYGLKNTGLIMIEVTEDKKEEVTKRLRSCRI